MPALDRLLQKTAMTAEEIGRLRKAYELALREIGVKDRDDPLTKELPKKLSRLGKPASRIRRRSPSWLSDLECRQRPQKGSCKQISASVREPHIGAALVQP
jgi:hypothetical protein